MLKIVIQTEADFTPKGKRAARIVETSGRFGRGRQLRWYVAGKVYRKFAAITPTDLNLTSAWLESV
jgi:hypothetical protein